MNTEVDDEGGLIILIEDDGPVGDPQSPAPIGGWLRGRVPIRMEP